jgi:hypothetical protein
VSTPPSSIAQSVKAAPRMKMYQLSRFNRGKATSFAPIISGTRKLPSTDGMEGIRKNQIMITPCMVNSLLYVSGSSSAPCGCRRCARIMVAANPPKTNMNVMLIKYRMPMRLWSVVNSHERMA